MLKRAHTGTFHKLSPKHLNRYVQEFAGKHNLLSADTIDQMRIVVLGLVGHRLLYKRLIANNGLDSDARGQFGTAEQYPHQCLRCDPGQVSLGVQLGPIAFLAGHRSWLTTG